MRQTFRALAAAKYFLDFRINPELFFGLAFEIVKFRNII